MVSVSKNKYALVRLSKFICFMIVLAVLWTVALSLSFHFETAPVLAGLQWPLILSPHTLSIFHICLWVLGLAAIYLGGQMASPA